MTQRSLESTKEAVRATEMKRSQAKTREVENAPFPETSPAKMMKAQHFKSAAGDMSYGFEIALEEANRDVSVLFSKYSEVLRERAAVDASQLGELEDILTEARSLESHLKEKKEHLRRSLALISDKLQG
uniref:Si:dkey-40g16.5 n=1 Tax=Sinocyclocheilus rhinocerous TaxID=307959 RepID=A0A673KGC4_9TELE